MNRLRSSTLSSESETTKHAGLLGQVEAAKFCTVDGPAPLAMFGPLHYESGYAYPLVVWLHGPRDDEGQLKRIMPLVSMRNFVAVAPRGPCRVSQADRRGGGHTWPSDPAATTLVQQRIEQSIAAAQGRYHVHSERIFVAGFDVGGTTAFRAAMNYPERFAGALSLCGGFPSQDSPLARLTDVRQLPLFLACGRDSPEYAPPQVCRDLRLFHAAGMNVTMRQYPCGHEITVGMLTDMNRWMMEQIGVA